MTRLHLVVLFLTISAFLSCRGYKDQASPLSPEQMQVSDMATALVNDAASLQQSTPAVLKQSMDDFADATARFQNLCLRRSSNSLESRKAFDKVMFLDAQINESPDLEKQPEFNAKWQELHKNRVLELAKKLGYRPEKD